MEMRIYSFDFRLLGVIDDVKSLMWIRRFAEGDSFEITVPLINKNQFLIQKYRIIDIPGKCSGFITSFKYAESSGCISFKGSSFDGLLERRILTSALRTDTVMELLDKIAGAAAEPSFRAFGNTIFDKSVDCPGGFLYPMKYMRINEYLENIARDKGFGVYSEFVHTGTAPYVRIYGKYGVDRSASQTDLPKVVFCDEYGNISDSGYTYSESGLINSVVCYSPQQSDFDRHIDVKEFTAYSDPVGDVSGYCLREEAVEITPSTKIVPMPVGEEQYVEWVKLDEEKTAETAAEQSAVSVVTAADCFDTELILDRNYRARFDVGDIVTILHKGWGIMSDRRITEITEYIDGVSEKYTAVLGEPIKPLKKLLKG